MKGKRTGRLCLRLALAAAGLLLAVLAVCNPYQTQEREEVNRGGRVEIGPLEAGSVVTQPIDNPRDGWTMLILRLERVTDAEGLTLTLALEGDGQTLAQGDYPLSGLRKGSNLELPLPSLGAGSYTLRVSAAGTGSAALNGRRADAPAALDGQALEAGAYLRLVYDQTQYSAQAIYMGLTLVLLSLVHLGGRKEARA